MNDPYPLRGEERHPAGGSLALQAAAANDAGSPVPPTAGELVLLYLPEPRPESGTRAAGTWRSWSGCWPTCWRKH